MTSGVTIVPGGAAGGNAKSILAAGALTVLAGVSNPGATNESNSATGVAMLQLALVANSVEAVNVTSVTEPLSAAYV